MNKGLSIAFLVVGVVLLFYGINAMHSASSAISNAATGAPSSKAIWLLIGGVILGLTGLVGTFRKVS